MATKRAKEEPRATPPKKREDATSMAARQREIAVSEFFSKNRHLLGFDNPTKALLTTVREAVDNALDACEEATILPEVTVQIDEVSESRYIVTITDNGPGIVKAQLGKIFGQLLYGSKFHRLKQSRGQQGIGISAAVMYGQMTTGQPAVVVSKIGKGKPAHRVALQIDTKKNRPEIVSEDVVDDAAWEARDHGTSISITLEGAYKGGKHSVDTYLRQTGLANPHATIVFISPKGERSTYPRVVDALPVEPVEILPHPHGIELGTLMQMLQDAGTQTLGTFLKGSFSRVTPPVVDEIAQHASLSPRMSANAASRGEVEALYKAIQQTKIMAPPTNCLSPIGEEALVKGLYWLFVEAQKNDALKSDDDDDDAPMRAARPGEDGPQMALDLDGSKRSVDVNQDKGADKKGEAASASPAEELKKLTLDEDFAVASESEQFFVTAVTRPPAVYRGNPFQIEVGLFYGKGLPADELARVYRFANRVPLQYQAAACAMSKSVVSVPWRNYEVAQAKGAPPMGPLVIMTHIASAWVPYTSESKEAIAPYDEIMKELRLAIMECGRRLQKFLRRKKREAEEHKKRSYITKYLDPIGEALQDILGLTDDQRDATLEDLKVILERTRGQKEKSEEGGGAKKKKSKAESDDDGPREAALD